MPSAIKEKEGERARSRSRSPELGTLGAPMVMARNTANSITMLGVPLSVACMTKNLEAGLGEIDHHDLMLIMVTLSLCLFLCWLIETVRAATLVDNVRRDVIAANSE